jgi:hypothetical protein
MVKALTTAKADKITCADIEIGLGHYFNPRVNMLIANVSWGFGIHECDVLVITKSGYLYEVEIKVSGSDLKKDADKPHKHESKRIKNLYFAIPYYLEPLIEFVPKRAGVLSFNTKSHWKPKVIREAKSNIEAKKVSDKELLELYRLAALRAWTLKESNERLHSEIQKVRALYESGRTY